MLLLHSMGAAVIVSIFVAVLLSAHFTKPLSKMKMAALKISSGNFNARTGVKQSDEIGELANILDNMAGKLAFTFKEREKLDKLRQDFVANISHELRTPITVMRGSLEALLDGVVSDTDKVLEYHTQMFGECKYLERLVSDLLDLSKLQNTDFAIDSQTINLQDLVDDVARTMARISQQKDICLTFIHKGDPLNFIGDYGRLRQMLIIVVDNAIKFSPYGGNVEIHLLRNENTAHIHIRDNGSGIHPNDLEHIFERFYKQRTEQNKIGTGLGLAIAKQIASRHSITINAGNHPSGGAEFTFVLPILDSIFFHVTPKR